MFIHFLIGGELLPILSQWGGLMTKFEVLLCDAYR